MNKIIVEVGSTCTKIDKYDGNKIEKLEGKTIQFKKHYNEDKKLRESDVDELIQSIKELKNISKDIYVCGTSIFRTMKDEERNDFLNKFKNETGYEFNIISQEKENELTVYGATRNVKEKVCVFIGGGGSTEIAIYDKSIKENVNTPIGGIDVMQEFPDLAEDFATTKLETVKRFIKERLKFPKEKGFVAARRRLFTFLAPLAKAVILPLSFVSKTTLRSYSPIGPACSTIPVTSTHSLILIALCLMAFPSHII